jgi:hypothetical protein
MDEEGMSCIVQEEDGMSSTFEGGRNVLDISKEGR